MKYLTIRKQFADKVVLDIESEYSYRKPLSKKRIQEIDALLKTRINEELNKIENKSSILI